MFYLPKTLLYFHFIFPFRPFASMVEFGHEWWTTPVVIPCSKRIVCFWHFGFCWKIIKYQMLEKLAWSNLLSGPRLAILMHTGKTLEISVAEGYSYSERELKTIADAILHNMHFVHGIPMKRSQVGSRCVVWGRDDRGTRGQARR